MPPLHLRQEFPTLKAFKDALHTWAIEAHFEPRILKSDTGRVRVGCKRDPNCPFVIRCNWERKGGREPLARVTVMREKHTCVNGVEAWRAAGNGGSGIEIRQDEEGNIVGGARVLGPVDRQREGLGMQRGDVGQPGDQIVPVLPKVQRNSASRLPFLLDKLPRIMNITKQTTPVEIRDCLMREFGAEVHLQQCRRAKTEILKQREQGEGVGIGVGGQDMNQQQQAQQQQGQMNQHQQQQQQQNQQQMNQQQQQQQNQNQAMNGRQSMDTSMGPRDAPADASQHIFADMSVSPNTHHGHASHGHAHAHAHAHAHNHSPHPFTLHTAQGVVTPVMPERSPALRTPIGGGPAGGGGGGAGGGAPSGGEPPMRCPYCINHRWMRSIKDAVEHMSMHVVV